MHRVVRVEVDQHAGATLRRDGGRGDLALARAGVGGACQAAAASAAIAPSAIPARGPATSASQPTSGAPIGVEPRKTTEYSAITRPRMAGVDGELQRRVDAGGEGHGHGAEGHEREDLQRRATARPRPAARARRTRSPRPTSIRGDDAPARAGGQRAGHRADRHRARSAARRSPPCRATSGWPAAAGGPGS